jgi:polysaccharide biosynthesis protein PslH
MGYFSSKPRSIIDTYQPEFLEAVVSAHARNHYDVVIASEIDMAPYALAVQGAVRILEELEVTSLYNAYRSQTHPISRLRGALTWYKMARYTARLVPSFDGCTVVSNLELAAIQKLTPEFKNIRIIPNGVDFAHYDGYPSVIREANSLIYSGALTYQANFDAVAYFLSDIFPKIQAIIPDVKFYITGKTDGVSLEKLPRHEGVVFTGYVKDIRSVLARCCVNVVPLRMGGGTRLKILETLAIGTPVVSTTKGAEGLNLTEGQDLLLADTPDEFAQAVVRLLGDQAYRERLSDSGKSAVKGQYDWRFIAENLLDAIQLWSQRHAAPRWLEMNTSQGSLGD